MEDINWYVLRKVIKGILGIGLSVICFVVYIGIIFSTERNILFPLLIITYISLIVFIVIWKRKMAKAAYLLLAVPLICLITGMSVVAYHNNIRKIPGISEQIYNLDEYSPFWELNILAALDENATLKIPDNLPVLDGATALLPVYASFAQAVYPKGSYDIYKGPVLCSKTGKAYKNLLEGKADIIFCAEPSEAQKQMFYENDIKLTMIPIGREAFVFFVNKENKIDNLTLDNIKGIYSGKIKNWMGDIINEVAEYRNFTGAIGYSFLFFSTGMVKKDLIKLLSINNIFPSKESIRDGSYPFSNDFYAIYIDKDEKNDNIDLLIEWIVSKQGQELIGKTGYVPIMDK